MCSGARVTSASGAGIWAISAAGCIRCFEQTDVTPAVSEAQIRRSGTRAAFICARLSFQFAFSSCRVAVGGKISSPRSHGGLDLSEIPPRPHGDPAAAAATGPAAALRLGCLAAPCVDDGLRNMPATNERAQPQWHVARSLHRCSLFLFRWSAEAAHSGGPLP